MQVGRPRGRPPVAARPIAARRAWRDDPWPRHERRLPTLDVRLKVLQRRRWIVVGQGCLGGPEMPAGDLHRLAPGRVPKVVRGAVFAAGVAEDDAGGTLHQRVVVVSAKEQTTALGDPLLVLACRAFEPIRIVDVIFFFHGADSTGAVKDSCMGEIDLAP